jgi:KUP system potassium uptake protein
MVMDIMLFSASTLKLLHGGWFPLLLGAILLTGMLTWKRGRELVFENLEKHAIPLDDFLQSLFVGAARPRGRHRDLPARRNRRRAARAAAQPVHNKVLHERVVFLTVHIREEPYVPENEQVEVVPLGHNCYQLNVTYGFKDEADIPDILRLCHACGLRSR